MADVNWTPLFSALVSLLGVIITVYLVPLIKSKASDAQLEKIRTVVNIAVQAAEQIFAEGGSGASKKEWVIEYLKEHNINVDEEQINALIEAAVYELNKD